MRIGSFGKEMALTYSSGASNFVSLYTSLLWLETPCASRTTVRYAARGCWVLMITPTCYLMLHICRL